jgi:hypothetical protein
VAAAGPPVSDGEAVGRAGPEGKGERWVTAGPERKGGGPWLGQNRCLG